MSLPLLIFDLDGTLVDTAPDILATLARTLTAFGFETGETGVSTTMIGRGSRSMIEQALDAQGRSAAAELIGDMHAAFLNDYADHICNESRIYPGVESCLDRFAAAGWQFAVCTNKLEALSVSLLGELNIKDRFAAICGADTVAACKPDPGHIIETVGRSDGDLGKTIMIGDSASDIGAARAAKVPVIGVTFGYTPTPIHLLEPDLLLDDFDALTLTDADRLIGMPVA
jgi:phosphoglycolate phosphatase